MNDYWSVTVAVNGEDILTIEKNMLSGIEEINQHYKSIETCAEHLLSFIGAYRTPPLALSDERIDQIAEVAEHNPTRSAIRGAIKVALSEATSHRS